MTTPRKTTRPARVPATRAPAAAQPQQQPEAFLIPTGLLVEVIKLVGSLPSQQGARTFLQLQQLRPVEAAEPEEPSE